MPHSRNKKIFLILLCFILLLFILTAVFYLFSQQNKKNDIQRLTQDISKESIKYKDVINQSQVQKALSIINNKNLSEKERYSALENIAFYFNVGYATSHKPEIREYGNSLKDPASKYFPKEYREGYFDVGCADPSCGETPDEELKQIQKEINETGISPELLDTITKNFDQTKYMPMNDEYKADKQSGFGLVLSQLAYENNPKASAAAERLRDYLKKKYSFEYIKRTN